MTDPSPEVMNVLVRLLEGVEVEPEALDKLSNEELIKLGAAGAGGRKLLHHVTVKLNQRGMTFAEIGEHLGAVESTASRWAKPPRPPGRRRQERGGESDSDA